MRGPRTLCAAVLLITLLCIAAVPHQAEASEDVLNRLSAAVKRGGTRVSKLLSFVRREVGTGKASHTPLEEAILRTAGWIVTDDEGQDWEIVTLKQGQEVGDAEVVPCPGESVSGVDCVVLPYKWASAVVVADDSSRRSLAGKHVGKGKAGKKASTSALSGARLRAAAAKKGHRCHRYPEICQPPYFSTARTCCYKSCKDLLTDPKNCGACGQYCAAGQDCKNGNCKKGKPPGMHPKGVGHRPSSEGMHPIGTGMHLWQPAPPGGLAPPPQGKRCHVYPEICLPPYTDKPLTCCYKACRDLQSEEANCGACGLQVPPGTKCCGGKAVDVLNDSKNCGACGKVCKAGEVCNQGQCPRIKGMHPPGQGMHPAGVGMHLWQPAPPGGIAPPPRGRRCHRYPEICSPPFTNKTLTCCFKSCRDLDFDDANCGACATPVPQGTTCCGGEPVDVQTDNSNCGKCGIVCKSPDYCTNGMCGY